MLFISGLLAFSLLLTMLVLRTCRKRRPARCHSKMHISAIDTKSELVHSPPAYEQIAAEKVSFSPQHCGAKSKYCVINTPSSLVHSLAQAYKNRYQVLANKTPSNDSNADSISVSSLPNYEEHSAKLSKNNQI